MLFNLETNKTEAKTYLDNLSGWVEIIKKKNTRSGQQNRALHLFFTMLSERLNELGMEHTYIGLKGMEIQVMYTPYIVKNFLWRTIQIALFNIESTKDINTEQINKILDVLTKFFAELGVPITFPNQFDYYLKLNYR